MGELTGKRVLITHTMVHQIMGSTVVALDLATYLRSEGAEVTIYASFVGDPMASIFRDRGLTLVDDQGLDPAVSWSDFDYIWVHSQVIPQFLARQIGQLAAGPRPIFIFHHMSALDYAPDEHPYIAGLEEALASLSTFVSPEAERALAPFFGEDRPPVAIYANPTPVEFSRIQRRATDGPQRVLVVSSHPPMELLEAVVLLRARGMEVTHMGEGGDLYGLLTAEILSDYDVVITIGKTVQYCLVGGIPVFVYDHFGGYGYLSEENFEHGAQRNFSGREGQIWAAEQIVDFLLSGYEDAVIFHSRTRDRHVANFSIDRSVTQLFADLRPRSLQPVPERTVRAWVSAQHFSARAFRDWGHRVDAVRARDDHYDELATLRLAHERLRNAAQVELEAARQEVVALRSSHSFRIGHLLLTPLSLLKRWSGRVSGGWR